MTIDPKSRLRRIARHHRVVFMVDMELRREGRVCVECLARSAVMYAWYLIV